MDISNGDVALTDLPLEVLEHVLQLLDLYTLLQISRTCRLLRTLALSPFLHQTRRTHAKRSLSQALSVRLSRASICPPQRWIWLSKTNVLSRSISKSLIKIRLSHNLEQRPRLDMLVDRGILPQPCANLSLSPLIVVLGETVKKNRLRDRLSQRLERRPNMRSLVELNIIPSECATDDDGRRHVSPQLVERRRRVMRERLKDGLRTWVESRALPRQQTKQSEVEDSERLSVKTLVRRLTTRAIKEQQSSTTSSRPLSAAGGRASAFLTTDRVSIEKKRAQAAWGREVEERKQREEKMRRDGGCTAPTRAHVLGLRRFWEGMVGGGQESRAVH